MKNRSMLFKPFMLSLALVMALSALAACSAPAQPQQQASAAQSTQNENQPVLNVDPPALTETFTEGDSNTVDEVVNVHNYGGGMMVWAATANVPWMWMENNNGAIERGLMAQVKVHISASGLKAGTYTTNINVEGTPADQSPQSIPVTVNVKPAPPPKTDVGTSQPKKAVPPPPWDYQEYKNTNYNFVLKYPTDYMARQLAVTGSTFGAVTGANTNKSDMIMVVVLGSYGTSVTDIVTEASKDATRLAGGRPNPKIVQSDNATTLADGVTPAYEYTIDSLSGGSPSTEFYAFGFKTGSRCVFFGAVATLDRAAARMQTWKQIAQTLELVEK